MKNLQCSVNPILHFSSEKNHFFINSSPADPEGSAGLISIVGLSCNCGVKINFFNYNASII